MVCEACQKVLLRRSKVLQRGHDWIELAHHKDVESLRKAAEDDQCILCYRLWRNVGEQMTSGVAMSKHAECRYATRAIIRYATHPLRFVKIVHILYGPPPHVVEFEFSGALSNFNLDIRQNDIRARRATLIVCYVS